METLLGVLALISMGWFVVGLINPTKAMFWAKKRTRLRVTGWFVLSVLVIGTAIQVFAPQVQQTAPAPATEQPAQAETPAPAKQAEPSPKSDAKAAYCAWARDQKAMALDLDRSFGFDPQHARQPDEVITLETDVVGTSLPKAKGAPSAGLVIKYFKGSRVKILERFFYGEQSADLLYKMEGNGMALENGQMVKKVVTGYVEPSAIRLDSDNFQTFSGKYFERKQGLEEKLKAKHPLAFAEGVQKQALADDWWGQCGK